MVEIARARYGLPALTSPSTAPLRSGSIVIIGGCGHVGLPLGLALAQAGREVIGLDLDAEKVARTSAGEMPFEDRGADELLVEMLGTGKFRCTTEQAVICEAEIVITVIGTPLDEHLNPTFDVFRDITRAEDSPLRAGQLFVLRSTVYPGTVERVADSLERRGLDIDVAFCPERVAEGVALEEIRSLPQIVAGCSERAQKRAEELFSLLTPEIVPLKPMEAELAKLYTNAWRYIQFSISNQFYMMANDFGLDFEAIHHAMTHGYPRTKGFPSAGFAAGPCLFKDTMQLSTFHGNSFFLGHAAMLVNEGLPNYVVKRAAARFDLRSLRVAILGMTFKANSDDPRDSLSYKLKKILHVECAEVLCTDPFLEGDPEILPLERVLRDADLFIIGAPHDVYRDVEFPKPVVDIWNITQQGSSIL